MTELIYLKKNYQKHFLMFILTMKQLQEKKDVLEKKTCRRFKSSNNGSCHFQIFQYSSRLSKEFMDPSASHKRY